RHLDVGVHAVSFGVVDGPARPPRQAQLGDHSHRPERDNRGAAVLTKWLAEIEAVQALALAVISEPIRVSPDRNLAEQLLIRTPKNADARSSTVAREEQSVILINEHAGHAGQSDGKRSKVTARPTAEHVDPIGAGVCDIDPALAQKDVGVIEPRLR